MLLEKDFLCSYIPTVVVFTTLYASYTTKTPKLCFDREGEKTEGDKKNVQQVYIWTKKGTV